MTVQLTRKSWESHKGWNVTGKGLSEALQAFENASALAKKTMISKDWDAMTDCLSDIGDQIKKNKAKLDQKLNKGTHEFLDALLAEAKRHDTIIMAHRVRLKQREGVMKQLDDYDRTLTEYQTFLKTHKNDELVRAQAMVKALLASDKKDDQEARKKLDAHIKKTWFNAWHKVYASIMQHDSVLKQNKITHAAILETAEKARIDTLVAEFKKVQAAAALVHDPMLDEIKKIGGSLTS